MVHQSVLNFNVLHHIKVQPMKCSLDFHQITIDTTAPQPGVVLDSERSQPDIDFQQSYTQHASWQGFFDRESGVLFYQYAFADACFTASDFTVPPTEMVISAGVKINTITQIIMFEPHGLTGGGFLRQLP